MRSVTVATTGGPVRGRVEDGVLVCRGIPYAGADRFGPPRPAPPWREPRDADDFGPIAPQVPGAQFQPADVPQSEDCLSLNVWAPADVGGGPRPVMVWIHGGAFRQGSGASPLYDGATLARRGDLVVVTFNYRVGALGFLAHPAVADGDGPAGNWGILDQVAALRWVADNAAAFGGDPGNVTVFGESAGATSVLILCGSPLARGLFHRAIAQSAAPVVTAPDVGAELAERLAAGLGVAVTGLRHVPVDDMLRVQSGMEDWGSVRIFSPCVDGTVLTRAPLAALAAGAGDGVPLLVGSNVDEWKLWAPMDPHSRDLDADRLRQRVERRLPGAGGEVIETFRAARADRGESTRDNDLWFAIESERFFRVPTTRAADAHAATDPRTWVYLFGWGSPAMHGWLGACHGLEIAFVFGNQGRGELAVFTGAGPVADALSARMLEAWVAFARTGDPSTPALPWPAHDPVRRPTMLFDAVCGVADAPREPEREVIDRHLPLLS